MSERIRIPEIIKDKVATRTRMHLEDDIMAAWGTKEDLEQFIRLLMDTPDVALDENDVMNYIDAIKTVHHLRMQSLMDTFSQVLHLDGYGTFEDVAQYMRDREKAHEEFETHHAVKAIRSGVKKKKGKGKKK